MQFLEPTWAVYGVDGDGDRDRYDPIDAIWGAANYLCASGAGDPERLRDAIWAYNHADWYVTKVLEEATAYEAVPVRGTGNALAVVDHPNLSLTPEARQDLLDGVKSTSKSSTYWPGRWSATPSPSRCSRPDTRSSSAAATASATTGTGGGLDIYAVDGETVSASSTAGRVLAEEAMAPATAGSAKRDRAALA